jgi:hypothetical protein
MTAAAILWQAAAADGLEFNDGTRLTGRVDRLDADAVELNICGSRRTYLRAAVRSIEFSSAAVQCREESPVPPGLAAGTRLVVKLSRPIDPAVDPVGQVIGGSLEQPVSRGDRLLIRKGAPVLVELQPARDAAEQAPPVLHVTAARLDSGWARIDAAADGDALTLGATPGRLSHHFTVQKPQELTSATRRAE